MFPGGQHMVPFLQSGKLRLLFANRAIASESLLNGAEQLLVIEWLGEKLHCSRLHRLHRHWNVAMPGDENDWNAETRVVQLLLKVQAIDSGKVYIQNQATGSIQPRSA